MFRWWLSCIVVWPGAAGMERVWTGGAGYRVLFVVWERDAG